MDKCARFHLYGQVLLSLVRLLDKPAAPSPTFDAANPDPASSWAPSRFQYRQFESHTVDGVHRSSGASAGVTAEKQLLPMQPGDVPVAADTSALETWVDFKPNTPVKDGVARFVRWYREFYVV